ncbi:MAG: ferritin family protein [Deltaproteobacteria bacterium]|nr:ferritin family protein [Deltaproteobacteria bacterium]
MDRMASIELALKNEQTEMAYYRAEAKRSTNPLARAMFETLARDEEEHARRLRGLHERLLAKGCWPLDLAVEVQGTNIRSVLDGLVARVSSAIHCEEDDIEALRKAAKFEASGAKFYATLSDACENPMEKSFFRFLAGIEREHLLSIEASLSFFQDPEGFNLARDKGGLDGA